MTREINNKMHPFSKWSLITLISSIVSAVIATGVGLFAIIIALMIGFSGTEPEKDIYIGYIFAVLYVLAIILFITSVVLSVIALIKKDINKPSKKTSKICLIIHLIIIIWFIVTTIIY